MPQGPPPGSPSLPPNLPLGEDHMLHPSPGVRGSSGGPSPPLPHSSACLAPLALVTLGCWGLRLCGWEQEKKACGAFPVTSSYIGLWVPLQGGTWAHTHVHTQVHWTSIPVHIFKERPWGAVMAALRVRGQDVDIGVGPNLLPQSLGHIPRLWSRWRWRVSGSDSQKHRFGWGWKLTRTLLSSRSIWGY